MIVRTWRGLARADGADAYVRHLEEDVFPALRTIDGHLGARALRRDSDGGVEFLVVTRWRSMDAIRAFAGDDLERAVVEPHARALFLEVDERVVHWEMALAAPGE